MHGLNTFDDDNEGGFFDETRRRPPRGRARRPQRSGPRRAGPEVGSNGVLRLAGLIALGIAIVFGFVLWIGSCSGQPKQDYTSYIDAMRPLARRSASVGKDFATALGTSGLTMQSFQSHLSAWSREQKADYVAAQRLQPPGPLQSAHAEALATFQLRAAGLVGLAATLRLAKERHDSAAAAAAALASNAQLLSASDVLWEQLYQLPATQILATQNVGGLIVPASRIVTTSDIVSASQLAILYQRLGAQSGTGVHGSEIIRTTAVDKGVAKPLSTSTSVTIAAGSGSGLVIDVVIQNSGNFPEVGIPVTLAVKAGNTNVSKQINTVGQLAAGAQATVAFTDIQVPASALSHNAFITVKIGRVPGETGLADNRASYPVFFRLATS